jgi:hypothetical protein
LCITAGVNGMANKRRHDPARERLLEAAEVRLHDFVRTMLTRLYAPPQTSWRHRLMLREMQQPTTATEELVRALP